MAWNELARITKTLADALEVFDWKLAAETVDDLIARIRRAEELLPAADAQRLLARLRRKRQLVPLARLAEALLASGQRAARVQRQYAQALIDLGYLTPAERMLHDLAHEAAGTVEEREARGLIGRIHKQIYVNGRESRRAADQDHLRRAINAYHEVYLRQPEEQLWHGINVVALADLAHRDGVSVPDAPDPRTLANAILRTLDRRESESADGLDAWDLATAMEAQVARSDARAALERALEYVQSPAADAFELGSTVRQLTEVWQLTEEHEPGKSLLPVLRAELVRRQGGSLTLRANQAVAEARPAVRTDLEKIFGAARFQTLQWYQQGLERAKSIGRVERLSGQGVGTGWLVRGEDFFREHAGELLVVTNHHVVSDPPYSGALRPGQAQLHLQMLDRVLPLQRIVWTSPPSEYDATFLTLAAPPKDAAPLELAPEPPALDDPPPRLYVIGHPGGRDLEFSLEDTNLLALDDRLLHYRTPTEGGSSGSPVFEDQDWRVVALHHAGRALMPRLDGEPGTYEANEGISIRAIQRAIAGDAAR